MRLLRTYPFILFVFITGIFFPCGGDLFAQTALSLHPDSRLQIEGRSNVNRFSCQATDYRGMALAEASKTPDHELTHTLSLLRLDIKVEGFDCGKRRMNSDLQEALRADEHPQIIFEYLSSDVVSEPGDRSKYYRIKGTGNLTAAGTTRRITFRAQGKYLSDGRMKAEGSKVIKMTDFEVEPPTGLFGLIKAEDELIVRFSLIATIKNK